LIDKEIILNCIKGKREAHSILYNTCIPYTYSIVSRYLPNREDQKDLIQESFAKVFKNIEKYDLSRGSFNLWLRKIVVNECLMFIRKNKRLPLLTSVNEVPEFQLCEEVKYDQLTKSDIENALSRMPEGYKIVFMLKVIDGYDHGEISKMLNIKKETSRSQLARAKKWMQKNLIDNRKNIAYGLF
jgi:RNA polymerase sigma-70 factor (ECF subfamily)